MKLKVGEQLVTLTVDPSLHKTSFFEGYDAHIAGGKIRSDEGTALINVRPYRYHRFRRQRLRI